MSGSVGATGGFLGGWRVWAAVGAGAVAIGGILWLLGAFGGGVKPPPRQAAAAVGRPSEFPARPPAPPPPAAEQRPQPAAPPPPPPPPGRPAPPRPRPSAMALYDDATPLRPPERRSAASSQDEKIAGMSVIRAQTIADAGWYLMPGDKIQCENLEPITARTGAPFSATVPFDVKGRTGDRILIPRMSRVVGTVARGLDDDGNERLAAVLSHVEGPSVPGKPTLVASLGEAPAADVIGQVDLDGNVKTHFWRRLGAVAAFAGLDAVSQAGGALAGAALSNAVNNATGGDGVGVGFYSFRGAGRSLAGREYQQQIRRPPSFERPQGQPCTVFVHKPLDFSVMKGYTR